MDGMKLVKSSQKQQPLLGRYSSCTSDQPTPRMQAPGCRGQDTAYYPGCSSLWQPSLHPLQWELLYKVLNPHFKPAFLLPTTLSFHQQPAVLSFPFGLLARNKEQVHPGIQPPCRAVGIPSSSTLQTDLPWSCAWCVFGCRVHPRKASVWGFLQPRGTWLDNENLICR